MLTRYLVTTNIRVPDALQRYEAERKERTTALVVFKACKRTNTIYNKVQDPDLTRVVV